MASSSRQSRPEPAATSGPSLSELLQLSQVDFELDFFGRILERHPDFLEALRCHASNLAAKKRFGESLQIERRIIQLRPADALAHYNLACSYALLRQPDLALSTLRKALEAPDPLLDRRQPISCGNGFSRVHDFLTRPSWARASLHLSLPGTSRACQ